MLFALSNQKEVLAGKITYKNIQLLQHAASAWFQDSARSVEARLLVAIKLVETPKLNITTGWMLPPPYPQGPKPGSMPLLGPSCSQEPIRLSAFTAILMLEALGGVG